MISKIGQFNNIQSNQLNVKMKLTWNEINRLGWARSDRWIMFIYFLSSADRYIHSWKHSTYTMPAIRLGTRLKHTKKKVENRNNREGNSKKNKGPVHWHVLALHQIIGFSLRVLTLWRIWENGESTEMPIVDSQPWPITNRLHLHFYFI